jgi:hypothetical protein
MGHPRGSPARPWANIHPNGAYLARANKNLVNRRRRVAGVQRKRVVVYPTCARSAYVALPSRIMSDGPLLWSIDTYWREQRFGEGHSYVKCWATANVLQLY